jgi:23S rRNA (uracil1939-C5)-methyltransferase
MPMNSGDTIQVSIERAVAGGRMLARHEGAIVLVGGALPGEVVEARVERVQRGTVWATATRVLEPSAERVGEPNPCGGCVFAHARYEHQLMLKQQIIEDAFRRVARVPLEAPVPVAGSPVAGYRMRARLHVAGGQVGFYREHTHELCDAATTGQLLASTTDVLTEVASRLGTIPGVVRHIELAENREADERTLHLELAPDADPSVLAALSGLSGVTGLSYGHAGSPRVRELWGEARVTDRFRRGSATWTLGRDTRAFFQGNRFLLDDLAAHVVDALYPGAVADLYAGVGLFSIAAAAQGRVPVVAVEGDVIAGAGLKRNIDDWRGLVQVKRESVEDYLRGRRHIHVQSVIVDPPRTGLSRAALEGVLKVKAARLVYVSCDVPTLARDVRALHEGGYRIRSLQAFDLFPQTAHVETVATFDLSA